MEPWCLILGFDGAIFYPLNGGKRYGPLFKGEPPRRRGPVSDTA